MANIYDAGKSAQEWINGKPEQSIEQRYDQAVEDGDYSQPDLDKVIIATERVIAAVERLRHAVVYVGDEVKEARYQTRPIVQTNTDYYYNARVRELLASQAASLVGIDRQLQDISYSLWLWRPYQLVFGVKVWWRRFRTGGFKVWWWRLRSRWWR